MAVVQYVRVLQQDVSVIQGPRIPETGGKVSEVATEDIVGSKKINPFSARRMNTLVHGVVDPLVRFAYPIVDSILVFLNDVDCSIIRSAIDDDVFNIVIGLGDDALDRLPDMFFPVEHDCDGGNERFFGTTRLQHTFLSQSAFELQRSTLFSSNIDSFLIPVNVILI
jgi:hypothetical protein